MDLEHRERANQSVKLTPTQEKIGRAVIRELTAVSKGEPQLFILEGFSGVGKTTLIDAFLPDISGENGIVVDPSEIGSTIREKGQCLVTSSVPTELERVIQTAKERFSDVGINQIVLPAMDESEIMPIVKAFGRDDNPLSEEEQAAFSLGIPPLVRQLSALGITKSSAARLSAGFLAQNLGGAFNIEDLLKKAERYLQIPPNSAIVSALTETRRGFEENIGGERDIQSRI